MGTPKLTDTVLGVQYEEMKDPAVKNFSIGDIVLLAAGEITPTLQQVLDSGHSLINGNNFQGNAAGNSNTGVNVNAFGSQATVFNEGNDINAFGVSSLIGNSGNHVNAFGAQTGNVNVYNSVNLFGKSATADGNHQLVLSKGSYFEPNFMARLSFNDITEDRKYELPDASGTIALTSDIPTPIVKNIKVTLTSAQLLNLFTTPIELVPAVTGKLLVPQFLFQKYNHVSTAYTTSGLFRVGLGSINFGIASFGAVITSADNAQGLNNFTYSQSASGLTYQNLPIVVGATTANPTGGNGTLDLYLTYLEVTL
jgi:hypothetical protein